MLCEPTREVGRSGGAGGGGGGRRRGLGTCSGMSGNAPPHLNRQRHAKTTKADAIQDAQTQLTSLPNCGVTKHLPEPKTGCGGCRRGTPIGGGGPCHCPDQVGPHVTFHTSHSYHRLPLPQPGTTCAVGGRPFPGGPSPRRDVQQLAVRQHKVPRDGRGVRGVYGGAVPLPSPQPP
jgi:hypothetical protein